VPTLIFNRKNKPITALRERKKVDLRLAIQDAALSLFAEQGYDVTTIEHITERAGTSTSSFFRYFRGKAEILLDRQGAHLPALRQRIIDRPKSENGLVAVSRALRDSVPTEIDPVRTARVTKAIASSPLLRGIFGEVSPNWIVAISEGLAGRCGNDKDPRDFRLAARLILATFGETVDAWIADGCRTDLGEAIEAAFADMQQLCAEWGER
jgi:AcrR family transcriptional regulator